MAHSIVAEKSFEFALRIISISRWLRNQKEYELGSQLLRAGTGIGSNVEEALAAISGPEFVAKMSIASKEARESCYWLRLLRESKTIPVVKIDPILKDCTDLIRILTSIVKTSQERMLKTPTHFTRLKTHN